LSITSANITTLNTYAISAATTLNDRISNVERLTVSDANTVSLDLARVDSINYVVLSAANTGGAVFSGFGPSGTMSLRVAGNDVDATLTDATGTSDVFTVALSNAAITNFGTLTVGTSTAVVEEVKVSTSESTPTSTVNAHTITLDGAGTKVLTVTGTESPRVTISSTAVTTLDASALTEGGASMLAASSLANIVGTGSIFGDTITSGSGNDSLSGGVGDDSLTGGSGIDTLDGGSGNDTVVAGSGADSLIGGDGTDTLEATGWTIGTTTDGGSSAVQGVVINLGSSAVTATTINAVASLGDGTNGDVNSDVTSVSNGQLVRLGTAATVSTRVTTFTGIENVIGSGGGDYIVGSSGANSISGGAGGDWINPGSGADTVDGGTGADAITITETTQSADRVTLTTGESVARSAETVTEAGILATETIVFANGVDVVTGFVSGTDTLDVTTAANYTLLAAGTAVQGLTVGNNYAIRGTWTAGTSTFAQADAGPDLLVFADIANAALTSALNTTAVVMVGVTALTTADFV